MTPEVFQEGLQTLTSRRPFRPFIIELIGGERFEVDHPNAIAWGESRAGVFFGPASVPHIFDSEGVLQFIGHGNRRSSAARPKKGKVKQ